MILINKEGEIRNKNKTKIIIDYNVSKSAKYNAMYGFKY